MAPNREDHGPRRKERTRGHIIEDLSENYLERKILLKGHVLRRPVRDYGVDATMFHFADDGTIENGEVRFQLKATDNLKVINRGTTISFPISTAHLDYWKSEIYPFLLVVYDAKMDKSYWLDIREYVDQHPDVCDPDKSMVNIHIPLANELTEKAIELFRARSLRIVDTLAKQEWIPDGKQKPR